MSVPSDKKKNRKTNQFWLPKFSDSTQPPDPVGIVPFPKPFEKRRVIKESAEQRKESVELGVWSWEKFVLGKACCWKKFGFQETKEPEV